MAYLIFSLSLLVVYAGLAILLHIQFGTLGIPNFGVVGFWGFGMYAMGVFVVQYDFSFVDALVVTVFLVGLASLALGYVVLRLDNQAVLCASIAFAAIVALLVITEKWLTFGVVGLGTIEYPIDFGGPTEFIYLVFLMLIVGGLQYYALRLRGSALGRLMIAIRDNEELAASLGKDTFRTKLRIFVISCGLMGLLGALSAPLNQFLTPNMLIPGVTFAVWIALILGGKEHSLGALLGVVITFGLFDILIETYVPLPPAYAVMVPNMKLFLYGALLVGILMYRPTGLLSGEVPDFLKPNAFKRSEDSK